MRKDGETKSIEFQKRLARGAIYGLMIANLASRAYRKIKKTKAPYNQLNLLNNDMQVSLRKLEVSPSRYFERYMFISKKIKYKQQQQQQQTIPFNWHVNLFS